MSMPQAVAVGFVLFSLVMLVLMALLFRTRKDGPRKFLLLSAAVYITGTVLIAVLYFFRPATRIDFLVLSESLILVIHASGIGLILFVAEKFRKASLPDDRETPIKR